MKEYKRPDYIVYTGAARLLRNVPAERHRTPDDLRTDHRDIIYTIVYIEFVHPLNEVILIEFKSRAILTPLQFKHVDFVNVPRECEPPPRGK